MQKPKKVNLQTSNSHKEEVNTYRGKFKDLPRHMLIRHLQKCIPPKIFYNLPTLPEDMRTDCDGEDLRIIAVVGAGASAPIKKRATALIEHLKNELYIDNKRHQQKIERIARRTGLKKEHFETQLLALTETPEQEKTVRDEICKQYKVPHPTLLAYEA